MAIQMRRGNKVNLDPNKLSDGEPAVCLDTNEVFVKSSGGLIALTSREQIESNYYDKEQIESDYYSKEQIADNYYDKIAVNGMLSEQLGCTVLYEENTAASTPNDTNDILQLTDSIFNYKYVEVYYSGFSNIGGKVRSSNKFSVDNQLPFTMTLHHAFPSSTDGGYFLQCGSIGMQSGGNENDGFDMLAILGGRSSRLDTSELVDGTLVQNVTVGFPFRVVKILGYKEINVPNVQIQ